MLQNKKKQETSMYQTNNRSEDLVFMLDSFYLISIYHAYSLFANE